MRVTDEMVYAAWNALDIALAGRLDGTEYAYGDHTPMKHALEQAFALSHASVQEAVAWFVQLDAPGYRDHGTKLGPFSKESEADAWTERREDGIEWKKVPLYLTPAQPPASAEVGRDAESTTSKAAVDDAMVERAVRAHRAVRMQYWHPLTNLPAVEREAMEAAIQAAHTTPAAEQGEGVG